MLTEDTALVLALHPHAEHGAVASFLGTQHGLLKGYVRGARGKRRRALFQPGNRVALRIRQRAPATLGTAEAELIESRALIAFHRGPALALEWLTTLTAIALAENVAVPRLAAALDALLAGLAAGLDGRKAGLAVARYERLLLDVSGFGLALDRCALGGPADALAFVSPRTGRAVSGPMIRGKPWHTRLLPLPAAFGGATPLPDEERAALALTGHFILREFGGERFVQLRERLVSALADTAPAGAVPDASPPSLPLCNRPSEG